MSRTRFTLLVSILALVSTLPLSGCSDPGPQFVDEGRTYTAESVTILLESSDSGNLGDQPTANSASLRQRALTELRAKGDAAQEAASTITRAFPASSTGVPYFVESARFTGKHAWVVLEARGRSGGILSDRLLWVIDDEGDVLFSSMR